jgi:hypothetical protein
LQLAEIGRHGVVVREGHPPQADRRFDLEALADRDLGDPRIGRGTGTGQQRQFRSVAMNAHDLRTGSFGDAFHQRPCRVKQLQLGGETGVARYE